MTPDTTSTPTDVELWGGVECTINRIGDRYLDQSERSGHASRIEDLDRLASLGITTLRYPVLWERVYREGDPDEPDWSWTDARLTRLRDLGIRVIAGLVHHGSGPRFTDLLDPQFPEKLATYARQVAERYPWLDAFTPVNEPLTTARFSAAYGLWYPHARDENAFARALLNQVKGTVLAMRAIREVIPHARLVQTDDLGQTHSTRPLLHQAAFENERRWVTWDLLTGRLQPGVRMWHHLQWAGIPRHEVDWFAENPCPPDVIGVNHYLTSERFLDHRLHRYPPHTHGGNAIQRYADVEAVRARAQGIEGPAELLRQCWERFHLPIAVTEAHLSSTREEQLRWLLEVWRGAHTARAAGAGVRAVTIWSLLGAYDWVSLLTRDEGHYEPGAFDLRAPEPRPTALVALARDLAAGRVPDHPIFDEPGWWRRPSTRLVYPPARSVQPRGPLALKTQRFSLSRHTPENLRPTATRPGGQQTRPVLITGRTGTLGRAFARLCDLRGIAYRLVSRQEMDVADPISVHRALDAFQPWAVVNTAGYVRVDDAEGEPDRCFRENGHGAALLAAACAARGIRLVTFSSDLVFDGAKAAHHQAGEPYPLYVESDPTNPLNVYGRSKAEAERRVLAADPTALVVRTSAFFGPWDQHNFVTVALGHLAAGLPFTAATDQVVSPTYVPDLVHASLDLLLDREQGIFHVASAGALSWYDFALQAAEMAGVDTAGLEGVPTAALGLRAARPAFSALGSERASLTVSLDVALARYLHDCRVHGADWLTAAKRRESRAA